MQQGKNPGLWIAAALILAVIVVALSVPRRPPPAVPAPQSSSASAKEGTRQESAEPSPASLPSAPAPPQTAALPLLNPATPPPAGPRAAMSAPGAGAILPAIPADPSPEPSPRAVSRSEAVQALDNVLFVLRDYRAALGGNPEGTNAEIATALMGKNLKQVRMELPDGSRLSQSGELCDPWGTPYFFHQVSAQKMEVRSAGPDLQMWTTDDIQM